MVVLHGSTNFTSRHAIRISPSAPIDPGCIEVLLRLEGPEAPANWHVILASDRPESPSAEETQYKGCLKRRT